MPSLNIVALMGSLCADPMLTTSRRGKPILKFTLAVDRTPGQPPKRGEANADFPVVVAYGETASQAYPFLHKGSVVAAKGYWQTRNYQQDGRKRVAMEMVAQEIAFVSGIDWSAAQEAEEEISQRIKSVIPEEMEALAANPGGTEDDDDGEG
jgi:single stranded DNA-binding protein